MTRWCTKYRLFEQEFSPNFVGFITTLLVLVVSVNYEKKLKYFSNRI